MDIYDRIFNLAKEKGISQTHLCESIGKESSYLRAKRRLYNKSGKTSHGLTNQIIYQLATALGTTSEYLLGKTDDPSLPAVRSREEAMATLSSEIELGVKTKIAKAMLSDGILSIKAIAKYTELSESEIRNLAQKSSEA